MEIVPIAIVYRSRRSVNARWIDGRIIAGNQRMI
jgi:hypothetical protein